MLNEKFKEYTEEKEKLQDENNALKDPLDIPQEKQEEEQVKEEKKEASDSLKKENKSAAKNHQKEAAKKMKQMGRKMQMQMQSGQMKTMDEDAEMLRQILDNLIIAFAKFSIVQAGDLYTNISPFFPFSNACKTNSTDCSKLIRNLVIFGFVIVIKLDVISIFIVLVLWLRCVLLILNVNI